MDRRDLLLLSLLPAARPLRAQAARVIRYPVFGDGDDPFRRYCIEALKLAAQRSGESYVLEPVPLPVGQGRVIRQMAAGEGPLQLIWSMTSEQRERQLLPLRIPLDRGLMGWRLLLIRRSDRALFAGMRGLQELRALTAGQMHDWPDTEILRANGLQVGTSSAFESLFTMLEHGRTDYFPRSVLEVEDELQRFGAGRKLIIAPGLMLRYPTAFYFFVKPGERQLAEDLARGLERAVADGSLLGLFLLHMRPLLKTLDLPGRLALRLSNPLLPAATPLRRSELWVEPGALA